MPGPSVQAEASSERLFEKAKTVLAGGISHQLRYVAPYPVYMCRGEGSRMWDVEGKEYIDYCMGSASLLLGHAHPDVVTALAEQAALGTFLGNSHPLEVRWAELVQEMVPSAERIRFVGTGSEASLLAIRLARAQTGRTKILRFEAHYHGWHDYATFGGEAPFDVSPTLGSLPGGDAATVVCPTDPERVEAALAADDDIAAIICEVSGASYGTVLLPDGFLATLRDFADRYGCVLIFDEVITGFRWSPGGIQALVDVTPDLTTLAKILTGGLPGGAVAGKEEIMRLLDPTVKVNGRGPAVVHKGTFNGASIIAAPAVAALEIVKTGEPQRHADAMAARLRDGMQRVLDEHQVAGCVYGESSTFHLYFGEGARGGIEGLSAVRIKDVPKETVAAFRRGIRERGMDLMSYLGGVTSAAHTETDVDETLGIFEDTIRELVEQGLVGRA